MTRCAQVAPSWERPAVRQRLATFAAEHPDLDLAPLHIAFDRPEDGPPDAW
ncbi:hypothetical protein [Pseudonocardia sp.]|uniref:hypothetical protein n=1 Tax=Pseudonocardia sp. TaxID=60912 RepID=UPI003D147873